MIKEEQTERPDIIKKNNIILNIDDEALMGYKKQKKFNRRIDELEKRICQLEEYIINLKKDEDA